MRIAVVGSGIAGLSSAWLLSRWHDVTLFEADTRLGGHTHTVDVALDGQTFPVDTGFLVFNHRTYPELTRLFDTLGVETVASEMTFSVRLDQPELEWAGSDLNTVFGQRRNLARPAFWSMLADLLRFNREVVRESMLTGSMALGDYLKAKGYGKPFIEWYLLPMAAAIWSCPASQMLEFPLASFVTFCRNHGLLQVMNRPQWRTVKGGGREYVKKLAAGIGEIHTGQRVESLRPRGSRIELASGSLSGLYDQVVLACHSDQSRDLLAAHFPSQARLLQRMPYQPNHAVLHSDASVLPRRRSLWSAWNYQSGQGELSDRPVAVHYLINRLQPLPTDTPVIVSLNPLQAPDPSKVHGEFHYSHPVFTRHATFVQRHLEATNGRNGVWLAGAWLGYGFHEDGLASALRVARRLNVCAPWKDMADAA
ncbi:MAG: FAD-dependent oxidoreductase [Thiobacillus sp.]|uniref:NAD(P)/FAD-dependent oxidoreductase n=1 Tax=Thiobacillus sp. TaxID=924 RepID=UPI0027370532|nr:FAD-dependent oxidoreductase [Thiobacillus sp.]MDP3583948.1 FAD-dependent oxidoreductase [Thiobacillus sp.]